jgi:hypothetical protein
VRPPEGGRERSPEAVASPEASVGRSPESDYFAFGGDSYFITCDLPNDEAPAVVALRVDGIGGVSRSTVKLATREQVDAAMKPSTAHRAPR